MGPDYYDILVDEGFNGLPAEVQGYLKKIESMPGDPASNWLKRNQFFDVRSKDYRRGRGVYTHIDTDGIVYKIGVDTKSWQNNIEQSIWEDKKHPSFEGKIPEGVLDYLAPVVISHQSEGDCHWLIMPEANVGAVQKEDAVELMENMLETGWAITDPHPDNFGMWGGKLVLIDYGQLKPESYLMDGWRGKMMKNKW